MEEHEAIDLQLNKLSLNLDLLISNQLNVSHESHDNEIDSMRFLLSPKVQLSSSFMSDSKFLPENQWMQEVEHLSYCFDQAQMKLEDYRSHEHREYLKEVKVRCTASDLEQLSLSLAKKESFSLDIDNTVLKFSLEEKEPKIRIQRTNTDERIKGKTDAMKRALEHYSDEVKRMKIQVAKEKDEVDRCKDELALQQTKLNTCKDEFDQRIATVKKNIQLFLDQLRVIQGPSDFQAEEKPEEVDEDQDSLTQQINNIENLLMTATGKLRESLQMQLNRLKTRLATLRTEAAIKNCSSGNSYSGRRSVCTTPLRNNRIVRFSTPIRSTRNSNKSFVLDNISTHEPLVKEVNIIKSRLQQREEEISKREISIKEWDNDRLTYRARMLQLEKDLSKTQDDIDRQKIMVADKIGKVNSAEQEFIHKQETLNTSIGRLKEDLTELIKTIY